MGEMQSLFFPPLGTTYGVKFMVVLQICDKYLVCSDDESYFNLIFKLVRVE